MRADTKTIAGSLHPMIEDDRRKQRLETLVTVATTTIAVLFVTVVAVIVGLA